MRAHEHHWESHNPKLKDSRAKKTDDDRKALEQRVPVMNESAGLSYMAIAAGVQACRLHPYAPRELLKRRLHSDIAGRIQI